MLKLLLLLLPFLMVNGPMALSNTIGSDHQNFNQGISFLDYLTVHSSRNLGQGVYSLSLGLNHGVNTLPYFDKELASRDADKEYNDGISAMDINLSIGILSNLDLSLSVPYLVHQKINDNQQYHGQFDKVGNTEIRAGFKWGLYRSESAGIAIIGTANHNRVKNNPYTGNEAWPSYSAELVAEIFMGPLKISGNFGRRWRNSGESIAFDNDTPIDPYQNQWLFSSAAEWMLNESNISLLAEIYGNYTKVNLSETSPRNASVLEAVGGVRFRPSDNLILQIGGGAELRHAVSSADQRYFVGLLWTFGDSKSDGKDIFDIEPLPNRIKISTNKPDEIIELEDILFAFDSSSLNYAAEYKKLEYLKMILAGSDKIQKIVVEGHACKIGSHAYNIGLSEDRADTILDWMVDEIGVPREIIIPVGYGSMLPAASNLNEQGRIRNRRVRFEIFYLNQS